MNRIVKISNEGRTAVVANGDFPRSERVAGLLSDSVRVVCCDGAARKLVEWGGTPDLIVGDMDSLDSALAARFANIVVDSADQQSTDLVKALRLCVSRGWTSVNVFGAAGGREDHFLGNIGVLSDFADQLDVQIVTDYGVFDAVCRPTRFESFAGCQVSLFMLDPSGNIGVDGLLYDPPADRLARLWHGVSNEAAGEFFDVRVGSPLVVFRSFDPK